MTEEQVLQMLISGRNDLLWFETNLKQLIDKYDNKFIAFCDSNVIDSDSNLDVLIARLNSCGIDVKNIFIRFVSKIKSIL